MASIFLFQGAYALGITPITVLYPSEILNFSIRADGMALWVLVVEATGCVRLLSLTLVDIKSTNAILPGSVLVTFVFPFALEAISWKLYMINGAYNALQAIFVYTFWVETRGMTLEAIDHLFDSFRSTREALEGTIEGKMVVEQPDNHAINDGVKMYTKATNESNRRVYLLRLRIYLRYRSFFYTSIF